MLPQGYGVQGSAALPGNMAAAQQGQVQSMPRGYPGSFQGYGGYSGYEPPYHASPQGAAQGAMMGATVPGGGAADGGWSAAYASWMQQGYGAQSHFGSTPGAGRGVGARPFKGKGKGKGKGRGFSKGGSGLFTAADAAKGAWEPAGSDPRKAIEAAQRRAKQRDRGAIAQAQKSALQRFEGDFLKRLQGSWVDAADATATFVVEDNLCTVSGGEHNKDNRVFRNRLSVLNGELCWDARRYWHTMKIDSLPPADEEVTRVEWTPGEGSPPTKPIVWLRFDGDQKAAEQPAESKEVEQPSQTVLSESEDAAQASRSEAPAEPAPEEREAS